MNLIVSFYIFVTFYLKKLGHNYVFESIKKNIWYFVGTGGKNVNMPIQHILLVLLHYRCMSRGMVLSNELDWSQFAQNSAEIECLTGFIILYFV